MPSRAVRIPVAAFNAKNDRTNVTKAEGRAIVKRLLEFGLNEDEPALLVPLATFARGVRDTSPNAIMGMAAITFMDYSIMG